MEVLSPSKTGNTRIIPEGAGVYPLVFDADHQTAIGALENPTTITFSQRFRWRRYISYLTQITNPYISRITFPGKVYFVWDSKKRLWIGA